MDEGLIRQIEREETLAQNVAGQLERLIVQQHLELGDRLPAERTLAEQFGVSRTVIREAVRTVASKGLLEVRAGSGTIVRKPSSESVAESVALLVSMNGQVTPAKVVEVRRILEVEIAGLAAERRTDDDLLYMENILFTAAQRIDDPLTFIESDVQFHASLARATQNELFRMLLASISNVMTEVRVIGLAVQGTPERALRYHRDIYRAVVTQDREAARQAMDRHMDEAIQTMTKSLAQMNAET